MTKRIGGKKRSSLLTFRRRLLLVRLLLRGAATKEELIAGVQRELGDEGFPPAATSALKHDFDSLKAEFGCVIKFQRRTGHYVLRDLGDLSLLDLPDNCMEALAFLETSFPPGTDLPKHANIRSLLDRILLLLPDERKEQHTNTNQQGAISLQMPGRATSRIDPKVLSKVKRGIQQRQEIVFDYLSRYDEGDEPRRHRVTPYNIYFTPEGHGYLDATLLDVSPKANHPPRYVAISYRLNRIVPGSVQILPTVLPPERIQPVVYDIKYKLVPLVARRRDVATYFPESKISYHRDGSATVTAKVTNLWQTRQVLLRYGSACTVLEPPELVQMFQETAEGFAEIYGTSQQD
jgi:predicted DNA-binding transcriptional regulator YafY